MPLLSRNKKSELCPIDDSSFTESEKEEKSSWFTRMITESLTGRLLSSAAQTTKHSAIAVVCLGPWGDSSPVVYPTVRFRDMAIETINIATGGTATLITPFASEVGGYADQYLIEEPIEAMCQDKDRLLKTENVQTVKITLRYRSTRKEALLGFYQASDTTTGSNIVNKTKDYFNTSTGWFCPYLYASGRTPIVPRKLTPDVIFAHGPFLQGDYDVAQTLLSQANKVISMSPQEKASSTHRRMIVTVLGLKPYRLGSWTSSARPSESILNYQLPDGCPTLVLPVRDGSPLVAWFAAGRTLSWLWKIDLGSENGRHARTEFDKHVHSLTEFLNMCVDWDRATDAKGKKGKGGRERLEQAVSLLVEGAVRSGESKKAGKEVDGDRAGIAMFRLP
ncbi:hypothetical protein BD626DRAFT_534869 [Schizophyllum amplum]|uniref:Uncharacterized protein n=1 Tax=Schizophyllum amplum TaxID=97359 RepID=A0A550CPQ0_9AGAR|nr:hypothetical protein BD626DRAFT_534869 [Auriculariopsis ampla]